MFSHEIKLRVRYADTDQMGYVYYGNYATYYEVARVEALRYVGFAYKNLEDVGIIMPVISLKCKYILPARYDDLLSIHIVIQEMPTVTILYKYNIYNQEGVHINTGETKLAFLNKKTGRPARLPLELKTVLAPFFT